MEHKIFSGVDEQELWNQIAEDLQNEQALFGYKAIIKQEDRQVLLHVDVDPGGGFEGGFAFTQFLTSLEDKDFQFAVYKQGLLQEAGKLLGMQDVEIGHPEFDKKYIIKSNQDEKVRRLFSDYQVRSSLSVLKDFELETTFETSETSESSSNMLQLTVEDAVLEEAELRQLFQAFCLIADRLKIERS
ncbi:MAG TPA: hypothetical protein VEZ55_00420 [Chitinophagaceae bacterium]|jgi:hypothetical protein|nr:hypothetical protein [Chitinophagaceae bacterium]